MRYKYNITEDALRAAFGDLLEIHDDLPFK